jgi:hypothetical protein
MTAEFHHVPHDNPVGRRPRVEEAEFEVLPPERAGDKEPVEPLFRWIAMLMDNLVRVPGTKFRIGIDPILGLIPGIGDTSSAMVSALALIQAARYGLPKIVLARMSVNILLNELIGIVPVVGDAFSCWFKSNARNHELVRAHIGGSRKAGRGDWIFVIGVLVVLALIVAAGIAVSLFVLQQLFQAVAAPRQ